jgi:predicted nucleic acid-binding protein
MPDEVRTVVINTAPIISLSLVSRLHLLRDLYQTVLIPPAVRAEAMRGGARAIGVAELQQADWIQTVPLQDPRRADLLSDLDRGEAEVLALAQESHADLVVIDERLARRHAQRLGIALTGTLGVLLRAKKHGLISEVRPLVEQIHQGGIRLSRLLIEETLRLAGEL